MLKIKREFTENEAVLSLLKIVKELEFEIGMLKSENDEAHHNIKMLKASAEKPKHVEQGDCRGVAKSKQAWLKDELVASQDKQIKEIEIKLTDLKKSCEYWQNKYCLLAAQKPGVSI